MFLQPTTLPSLKQSSSSAALYLSGSRSSSLIKAHIKTSWCRAAQAVATMTSPTVERTHPGRQLLSVAPMMDWTDVHYRQLARIISKRTWLWTEMVVDKTIIHTQLLDKFLWFPPEQHPVVLQIGGSDPATLAEATRKALSYGYDEINLNCGCPSDRVAGAGCFGAALMLQPEVVAQCMAAMGEAAQGTPVNVKCRLGVDQVDSYDALCHFIKTVSEQSPVKHFIIHSRKCFLKGLNPHQNRTIPPLKYEWVYGLKRDFPHLTFSLNGGIQGSYEAMAYINYDGPFGEEAQQQQHEAEHHAATDVPDSDSAQGGGLSTSCQQGNTVRPPGGWIEGCMIGRQAYNDPWGVLSDADRAVFGEPANPAANRRQVLQRYSEYAASIQGRWSGSSAGDREDPGVRLLMKPVLNLFHGEKGSKKWKSYVDTLLQQDPPSVEYVIQQSIHLLPDEVLDAPPRTGPCADAASRGITSALQPKQILLPRLPRSGDRAGNNQEPDGVDKKRSKAAVVHHQPSHINDSEQQHSATVPVQSGVVVNA